MPPRRANRVLERAPSGAPEHVIRRKPAKLALAGVAILVASLLSHRAWAAQGETLFGRWITESGNLEVEIAACGNAVCGTVVKVLANRSMNGPDEMVAADKRNPLGMIILKDFTRSGEGEWQGEIYNRENAKTYSCKLSLDSSDQLVVRAYVVLPLFGKSQVWRRAAANDASSK